MRCMRLFIYHFVSKVQFCLSVINYEANAVRVHYVETKEEQNSEYNNHFESAITFGEEIQQSGDSFVGCLAFRYL